jgi:hypothetical protein
VQGTYHDYFNQDPGNGCRRRLRRIITAVPGLTLYLPPVCPNSIEGRRRTRSRDSHLALVLRVLLLLQNMRHPEQAAVLLRGLSSSR